VYFLVSEGGPFSEALFPTQERNGGMCIGRFSYMPNVRKVNGVCVCLCFASLFVF
jgi:hypothetical protein